MRRLRVSIACFALAVLAPNLAAAQIPCHNYPTGGVSLRWDRCYGDGGVASKTFACNTNSGSEVLVASYVSQQEIQSVNGMNFDLDVVSSSGSFPSWWLMAGSGVCRSSTLSLNALVNPSEVVCQNAWSGGEVGAVTVSAGYGGAGTRQIRGVLAVPQSDLFTVPAGDEMLACRIVISHAKTLGPCGGCATPACLALSDVIVTVANENCDYLIRGPANGTDSHLATWQGASVASWNSHPIPGEYVYWYTTDMNCAAATPARKPTWGSIKSLYR